MSAYAMTDNCCKANTGMIYNVGLYLRLSREDESSGQSESITNQKEFLTALVLEQGWSLVDIYIDDGYTGTNFNRPGFKRLLKDIESKRINMVATKDLSRLGRDYIDTGYYIERYFPEHNVRYIAVNDGIDTFSNNSGNDMSPFKSVMNDMYAKDISKKVRTAMKTKREKGEYVGGFTAYGYVKDPKDKNKLIIDENTAGIVKRIFSMYIHGMGFARIARTLNSEGIPSPGAYKMQNTNYRRPNSLHLWADATVRDILKNLVYTGSMAQSRYMKVNYKVKKLIRMPRESWIVVENTHVPIVDKETFALAQEIISRNIGKDSGNEKAHLLSGLIYCGDCGEKLSFAKSTQGVTYTLCSRYKRFRHCTRHSVREDDLQAFILSDLKRIAENTLHREHFIHSANERLNSRNDKNSDKEIKVIENRLVEIKKIIKSLYEDKVKGILTEQDFLEFSQGYNKEREQEVFKLSKLQQEKEYSKHGEKESNALLRLVQSFIAFQHVNRIILAKLIDKIVIYDKQRIEIHYKFKKPC